jgi:POT family proton-dependent oligopeptide transporter
MAAYFTPLIGGLVADRWLGRKRAVIVGGAIMALGHFMLAFKALFFPGLGAIALGNGRSGRQKRTAIHLGREGSD